ncbi:DUF3397 family protein [Bacillus sp. FJAT-42376]|uniref:DUF3397 family protein n=1 Tax=Bacillus sp. FJAT-42376 TaxID=2014076 RepID=UPI0013DDA05D|nr:DUF3397 family protein [Bacillus sp. FJAT-42376]
MAGILTLLLGAAAIGPAVCFVLLILALKSITGKPKKAVLAAADLCVMVFFFSVYIKTITIWELNGAVFLFWSGMAWILIFVLFYSLAGWKKPGNAFKKMWRLSFLVYFSVSFLLFLYGAGIFIFNELH